MSANTREVSVIYAKDRIIVHDDATREELTAIVAANPGKTVVRASSLRYTAPDSAAFEARIAAMERRIARLEQSQHQASRQQASTVKVADVSGDAKERPSKAEPDYEAMDYGSLYKLAVNRLGAKFTQQVVTKYATRRTAALRHFLRKLDDNRLVPSAK